MKGTRPDPPQLWIYAIDGTHDQYRHTEDDVTPEMEIHFKTILMRIIIAYTPSITTVRNLDKSQLYTINISLINRLSQDVTHTLF